MYAMAHALHKMITDICEAEDEEETSKELMAASSSTDEASSGGQPGRKTPCFMYWSAECPEGALIPLRQPQPPVYFEPVK